MPSTRDSYNHLQSWLIANGIKGYDPYDVMGNPMMRAITRRAKADRRSAKYWFYLVALVRHFPKASRRLMFVRRSVNAKGVGLLLAGWVRSRVLGASAPENRGAELVQWLADNASRSSAGVGWGYPFDWQNRIPIPKGTPSCVVTSTCGNALLDYADLTGDKQAEGLAEGAAEFLFGGLNRHTTESGAVCLSYTPLDDFQVHNANIMSAAFLLRAGRRFGRGEWVDLAYSCLWFTLGEQQADGSWEYWSKAQKTNSQIDHYHTGFILRSLVSFAEDGSKEAAEGLARGWDFYVANLFGENGRPLGAPRMHLPLDIHVCSEAILCPAVLAGGFGDDALRLAEAAAAWTLANMQNRDGSFGYRLSGRGLNRMPYLRWGQAWMYLALGELLLAQERASVRNTQSAS